ncbi:MAG: diacylglycerol kinase family protein [Planctomycetota bacterium]
MNEPIDGTPLDVAWVPDFLDGNKPSVLLMISRIRSFGYAAAGLAYLLRMQPNARIHLGVSVFVIALAIWLGVDAVAWTMLVFAIAMVWVGESFNTSVEAILDLLHPESHPLAKAAKDVAAAVVLLASIAATVIGLLILGPPLWQTLFD